MEYLPPDTASLAVPVALSIVSLPFTGGSGVIVSVVKCALADAPPQSVMVPAAAAVPKTASAAIAAIERDTRMVGVADTGTEVAGRKPQGRQRLLGGAAERHCSVQWPPEEPKNKLLRRPNALIHLEHREILLKRRSALLPSAVERPPSAAASGTPARQGHNCPVSLL